MDAFEGAGRQRTPTHMQYMHIYVYRQRATET